jgi:hypothetical protein
VGRVEPAGTVVISRGGAGAGTERGASQVVRGTEG